MPYFIYKIGGPFKLLEKQGEADSFKAAKALANEHRRGLDPNSGYAVKMIFADNELAAEDVLSQPREAETGMIGDDY
ncbi:MAG: hypothetical protein COW48_00065 [Hydrogenophilales bacterium CG17_big_fil_post_rev_8_21_14_2_50_63_12]|nr:MAG: hypothetical protein COW48_00065 [Hydrogenophilales bacterium CG17_big_fil_post_rev_8_21_14_2_50_63_12]PIX98244.1 MAG: hypothetical protein COZ24_01315 [Hydrogenophilales bacterium CG_4_10_14_3_um_filter_63_21]PJB03467.1 MAG: hypothetical protein CO126_06640 [Hydrogenophilales bacterium CG_4_9_14_3_um_filter_63_34]